MQMLADAGYPDGFKVPLYCSSEPSSQDHAALLADQWAKIGVDAEIIANEAVVHNTSLYDVTYKGSAIASHEISDPVNALVRFGLTTGYCNFGAYSNSHYDELMHELLLELDEDKKIPIEKEAGLILLKEVGPYIPLYAQISGHYWWPWIKNYYGEISADDGGVASIITYCWVDEDLKKEMGYK